VDVQFVVPRDAMEATVQALHRRLVERKEAAEKTAAQQPDKAATRLAA